MSSNQKNSSPSARKGNPEVPGFCARDLIVGKLTPTWQLSVYPGCRFRPAGDTTGFRFETYHNEATGRLHYRYADTLTDAGSTETNYRDRSSRPYYVFAGWAPGFEPRSSSRALSGGISRAAKALQEYLAERK